MGMVNQYEVHLINLDPTIGHEIKKTRPCLVISPNEMNSSVRTFIIAPMTTKAHDYPTRLGVFFKGKNGWIVLDQICAIDSHRLVKKLGTIDKETIKKVKTVLKEMLVD